MQTVFIIQSCCRQSIASALVGHYWARTMESFVWNRFWARLLKRLFRGFCLIEISWGSIHLRFAYLCWVVVLKLIVWFLDQSNSWGHRSYHSLPNHSRHCHWSHQQIFLQSWSHSFAIQANFNHCCLSSRIARFVVCQLLLKSIVAIVNTRRWFICFDSIELIWLAFRNGREQFQHYH